MNKISLIFFAAFALCACKGAAAQSVPGSDSIISSVNYVGVSVSDINRPAAFYADSANLQSVRSSLLEGNYASDAIAVSEDVAAEDL